MRCGMRHVCGFHFALAAILSLSVASSKAAEQTPAAPPATMRDRIERYLADLGALERFYDVTISPERHSRLNQFYEQQLKDLAAVDFNSLDQGGRVDYLLFKAKLNFEAKQLDYRQKQWEEIADAFPFAQKIADLEESRQHMQPLDSEKAAHLMTELAKEIADAQKVAREKLSTSAGKNHVDIAILGRRAGMAAGRLDATLRHWYHFYDHYNPE